jgi:hypothetical protein
LPTCSICAGVDAHASRISGVPRTWWTNDDPALGLLGYFEVLYQMEAKRLAIERESFIVVTNDERHQTENLCHAR